MRIALLCHNYLPHPGGVEIVVQSLAGEFSRLHEVTVVSSAWRGNSGLSREGNVEVHRLPALHAAERIGVPYPVPVGPGVARAVRALARADVLHAHGALYPTSVLASLVSKRQGIPLVLTEHVGFVEYRSSALNAAQRAAWSLIGDAVVRQASAVTAVGGRVASWLRGRNPDKEPRTIPNGVDCARFRPLAADERAAARAALGLPAHALLALFVGRHTSKKNLDAVLRIPRQDFQLVLCGEQSSLEGPGLIDLGLLPHDRMPRLLGCADLLVHAGVGEGFPLAVQEAIACGLPVALLWDRGYESTLDPRLVRACDTLDELAAGVRELAASAERRIALSARALAWARERWSWTHAAGQYQLIFDAVRGQA